MGPRPQQITWCSHFVCIVPYNIPSAAGEGTDCEGVGTTSHTHLYLLPLTLNLVIGGDTKARERWGNQLKLERGGDTKAKERWGQARERTPILVRGGDTMLVRGGDTRASERWGNQS